MPNSSTGGKNTPERRHRRYTVEWNVEIETEDWSDALQLATENISRGGIFVRSPQPPPKGSRVKVGLCLPDGTTLRVEGEVVHLVTAERAAADGMAAGFGLRFDEQHAHDLNLLEAIASSHSAGKYRQQIDEETYTTLKAVVATMDGRVAHQTTAHTLVKAAAEPVQETLDDAIPIDIDLGPTAQTLREVPIVRPSPTPETGDVAQAIFGIDFGTTYTNIALVTGDHIRVFEDESGHPMLPSVVSYPEQGPPIVGWAAREQLALSPATTIASPKRLIGRTYDDKSILPLLASSAVPLYEGPSGQLVAELHGEQVAMPQICAEVIRAIARLAERELGQKVRWAVISAPISFHDERRGIRRACELAGIEVVEIIDEPVAAALAHGLYRSPDQLAAVYDLGGGTFDACLVRLKRKGGVEVLGAAGDPWLGGDDFDLALANHAADMFWRERKVDLRQRQVEWQRLRMMCEMAKLKLSVEQEVTLVAKGMLLTLRGPLDLRMDITRGLFDSLCRDLVERSLEIMDTCLSMAGVTAAEVDDVVLMGGMTRVPMVRERLNQHFSRNIPLRVDPELAVTIGNAIYGRFLTLQSKRTE